MSSEVHQVWEDCAHWRSAHERSMDVACCSHKTSFRLRVIDLVASACGDGRRVEGRVSDAIKALTTGNREAARNVVAADSAIDEMQRTIDEQVIETIAKRQPVAVDLREVLSIFRIANDLERIGDLAKNIGKRFQT